MHQHIIYLWLCGDGSELVGLFSKCSFNYKLEFMRTDMDVNFCLIEGVAMLMVRMVVTRQKHVQEKSRAVQGCNLAFTSKCALLRS